MQSLQRMEDKLKAVTKENIEMVGTGEQNDYICMICVCYGGPVCLVYVPGENVFYIVCNTVDTATLRCSRLTYCTIVNYAYECNTFTWMHNHSL